MAISVVQTQTNTGSSVSSLAVTLTSTAAQNTIIVAVAAQFATVTGVQTSGGQNLVQAVAQGAASQAQAEIWYLDNVPGGQTSVTATLSGSATGVEVTAREVSGVYAAGGSLDKTNVGSLGPVTSPMSWTSNATGTLSQASEIVIGISAQFASSGTITGPGSPWTNTAQLNSGSFRRSMSGSNIVAATTSLSYAGSTTFSGNGDAATVIATFKAGTPPSASSTPFRLPNVARGRPSAVRGTTRSSPGARYVAFPSAFRLPPQPAKGARGIPGSSASSPGAPYVSFPSAFRLPTSPARGRPSATRGTTRQAVGTKFIHIVPPGPSPFTAPTGAARGRPSARRGTSASSPGAPYFHVSAFTLPTSAATGTPSARRGRSASSPGAKWVSVTTPSPFILPTRPARGRPAAVQGTSASSPGARFVLIRVSPFTLPKKPAKGRQILRRGSGRGGFAVNAGSPPVPRELILVLAARAGVDDYGNDYPQGILATEGVIEGPTLIGSDAFFYSPSPGFGNLTQSIAEADGADQYGNAYIAGTATYADNGSFWSAVVVADGVVNWYMATGPGGPWTSEAGIGFSWNNITGGGLEFTGPAGNDMTGDLNVAGSITVTTSLVVAGTDVGSALNAIQSALSGASTSNNGIANGQITGTSGGASAGTAHTHGGGSYSVTDGHHSHTLPTF